MITARQIKILRFLEKQTDWTSLKTIGEALNYSDKTIRTDIQQMETSFPPDWSIERLRGKGVRLLKPVDENINTLNNIENEHIILYNMYHFILENEHPTLEKLSDHFYFHMTTTRDYVKQLELFLNKHELQLARSPLRILGDETYIRIVHYKLLVAAFGEQNLYYQQQEEHNPMPLIQQLKTLGIRILSQPIFKFHLYFTFSRHRMAQGHFVEALEDEELIRNHPLYLKWKTIIEEHYNVKLPEVEAVEAFSFFFFLDFTWHKHIYDYSKTYESLMLEREDRPLLFSFIQHLEDSFELPSLREDKAFISHLFDFQQRLNYRLMNLKFIQLDDSFINAPVRKKFEKQMTILKKICAKWTEKHDLPPLSTDLILHLALFLERHLLMFHLMRQRLLFLFSDSLTLKMWTNATLFQYFSDDLEVTSIPYYEWHPTMQDQYDIIITDTPIPALENKVILIDMILKDQDIIVIRKEVKQLQLEKRTQFWMDAHNK